MSKRTKGIIVTGVLLVIAIATLSYALWSKTFTQTGENELASGCFEMEFTDESKALNLQNAYPMTAEEGMATESYDVTINNKCSTTVKYDVILNSLDNNDLADEHVRVGVENNVSLLTNNATVTKTVDNATTAYRIKDGIIAPETEQTIHIRIWMDEDTSELDGENKIFKSKVTIESAVADSRLLATKILANNELKTETPDFTIGEPSESGENTGSGLYTAQDDQGTSYYLRGAKSQLNNNVEFAGKNWKIIRINGDESIRLVLVDNFTSDSHPLSIGEEYFNDFYDYGIAHHNMVGFTYNNEIHNCTQGNPCEVTYANKTFFNKNFGGTNSDVKTKLETWYSNNLDSVNDKIATGYFCNDTSSPRYEYDATSTLTVYYGAYERTRSSGDSYENSTLQCPDPKDKSNKTRNYGGLYKTKIGLLTADEMNMAGLLHATSSNYLYYDSDWWSLSPSSSEIDAGVFGGYDGGFSSTQVYSGINVVPVINLKADVQVSSGDGSALSPFVIE